MVDVWGIYRSESKGKPRHQHQCSHSLGGLQVVVRLAVLLGNRESSRLPGVRALSKASGVPWQK